MSSSSKVDINPFYLECWCQMLKNGYFSIDDLLDELLVSDGFSSCIDCISDVRVIRKRLKSLLYKIQNRRDDVDINDQYCNDYYESVCKV